MIKVTSPDKMSPTAIKLGFGRIKNTNSKYRAKRESRIINWGWENLPEHVEQAGIVVNDPRKSLYVGDKLKFFKAITPELEKGYEDYVNIVPWTENRNEAEQWIHDGNKVVCRTVLRGFGGEGIVLAETKDQLVEAKLYTKYIPKRNEYRVHYIKEGGTFTQRKARNKDIPDDQVNWQIRNHDNGFVFAHKEDHKIPEEVTMAARYIIMASRLDFGAVDIVWNERQQKAYVLEINVAPGLENTTLDFYKKGLSDHLRYMYY